MMLYLDAKPSHVGVDVDRLAYSLHRPTGLQPLEGRLELPIRCCPHPIMLQWAMVPFQGMSSPPGLDI
jgi:hypothetical protein